MNNPLDELKAWCEAELKAAKHENSFLTVADNRWWVLTGRIEALSDLLIQIAKGAE